MKISWFPSGEPCTLEELRSEGIDAESSPDLALKAKEGGYVKQDSVSLAPSPSLDAIKDKFKKEHYHDQDEVRFITAGEGIFDIRPAHYDNICRRSTARGWIRIEVSAGDYIQIPAGRYHRFFLTDANTISATRLFKDHSGWIAHYREASPE